MLDELVDEFGHEILKRTSVLTEFETFIKDIKGYSCLEIGSYNGISAALLSKHFKRVIGVSIDTAPTRCDEVLEFLGIDNVTIYHVGSNEEKYELIKTLDFDFAYLDGDHNYTLDDWEATNHCGNILFHEYWQLQPLVWNLVNSLPENEVRKAQFGCFALWTQS